MTRPRELCTQCGFDSDLYDHNDTITSQRVIPAVLTAAIEGLDDQTLQRRPDDATWSIAEYLAHVREVTFGNRFVIESALANPGCDLGDPPPSIISDTPARIDTARALAGIATEFEALHDLLAGLDPLAWEIPITAEGIERPVGWFARHVLHDGLDHLGDIGRIRHRLGFGAATQRGTIHALHSSSGGVPKDPVARAEIGPAGMAGDQQADRRHHGRPVQALCLWSEDVIAALQGEGHPIAAGNAGENITVVGIDWASLRPGARIDVGGVPLLISAHAIPCAKNAQWFADRDFNRILHDQHPGYSRLYAIPLGAGTVAVGDVVIVEP